MKHRVEIFGKDCETYEFPDQIIDDLSKSQAIDEAKKASTPNNRVFISGHNGESTVYLNPDGNYQLSGESW